MNDIEWLDYAKKAGFAICICASLASPYLACTKGYCRVHHDLPAEPQRTVERWDVFTLTTTTASGTSIYNSSTTTTL